MSTRGIFGFKYKDELKVMYNHGDSYPSYLGFKMLEFVKNHKPRSMKILFNKIKMVDQLGVPKKSEYNIYRKLLELETDPNLKEYHQMVCDRTEYKDEMDQYNKRYTKEYFCLLHPLMGNPEFLYKVPIMTDDQEFLDNEDGFLCEWAYIINLDTGQLEIYTQGKELYLKLWFDDSKRDKSNDKWYFQDINDIEDLKSFVLGVESVGKNI